MNNGKLMINKFFYALVVSGVATFSAIAMDRKPMVLRSEGTPEIKQSRKANLDKAQGVNQSNTTPLRRIVKDDGSKSDLTEVPYRLPSTEQRNDLSSKRSNNLEGSQPVFEKFNPRKLKAVDELKKETKKNKLEARIIETKEQDKQALAVRMELLNVGFNAANGFNLEEKVESPKKSFASYKSIQKPIKSIQLNDNSDCLVQLSSEIMMINDLQSDDSRVTRSTGQFPIAAPIILSNAQEAKQENLTPLTRIVKNISKNGDVKKMKNLSSSSSSDDSSRD